MRHQRLSPPPPIPTEDAIGDGLLVDTVVWLSLWISIALAMLCVYQRTRSELHVPTLPQRIRFSLFRSPHLSVTY